MTDITGDSLNGSAEAGEGIGNAEIDLSRVGLSRNWVAAWEACLLAEKLIEFVNLPIITLEDFHETSLSTSCTLSATITEISSNFGNVVQVHKKVLYPLACSATNSDQLCRLEVGVSQSWHFLVFQSELGQLVDDDSQLGDDEVKGITLKDKVGVVSAVARGSTVMDDTSGLWSDLTECMNVSHNIVSASLLLLTGNPEVLVGHDPMCLHLFNSLLTDIQAQFSLSLSEIDPKGAPCGSTVSR